MPSPKSQKNFIEGPQPSEGFSNRVLFRVLSLSVMEFSVGFSMIKSSLGSSGIVLSLEFLMTESSLGSSVIRSSLFMVLRSRVVFNVSLISFVLFYIIFSKRPSHLKAGANQSNISSNIFKSFNEILDEFFTRLFIHFYPIPTTTHSWNIT